MFSFRFPNYICMHLENLTSDNAKMTNWIRWCYIEKNCFSAFTGTAEGAGSISWVSSSKLELKRLYLGKRHRVKWWLESTFTDSRGLFTHLIDLILWYLDCPLNFRCFDTWYRYFTRPKSLLITIFLRPPLQFTHSFSHSLVLRGEANPMTRFTKNQWNYFLDFKN